MARVPGLNMGRKVVGLVVAAYLVLLLHLFGLVRLVLPRACWVARLDRRWIDLWLR